LFRNGWRACSTSYTKRVILPSGEMEEANLSSVQPLSGIGFEDIEDKNKRGKISYQ